MSLPADVADDVDVAEEVHRAHHVSDRLDDVHVAAYALLEHVGGVAGGAEAGDLEDRARFSTPSLSSASSSLVSWIGLPLESW